MLRKETTTASMVTTVTVAFTQIIFPFTMNKLSMKYSQTKSEREMRRLDRNSQNRPSFYTFLKGEQRETYINMQSSNKTKKFAKCLKNISNFKFAPNKFLTRSFDRTRMLVFKTFRAFRQSPFSCFMPPRE